MTYELAKQLKDAGFPGLEAEYAICAAGEGYACGCWPTLSELIEACGDDFNKLIRGWQGDSWVAVGPRTNDNTLAEDGQTAEEAVAKLWLALHTSTSSTNPSK